MGTFTHAKVLAILSEIIHSIEDVNADVIRETDRFAEDLDMDSLPIMQLAVAVKTRFGIEITSDDLLGFRTVSDVVSYVEDALPVGFESDASRR